MDMDPYWEVTTQGTPHTNGENTRSLEDAYEIKIKTNRTIRNSNDNNAIRNWNDNDVKGCMQRIWIHIGK